MGIGMAPMELGAMVSGALTGLVVGMTGVGGGAIMTPLLIFVLGVAPSVAVGTDLLFASITKIGAVWIHGTRGRVDWQIVRRLAAGSIPAVAIVLTSMHLLSMGQGGDPILRRAIGAAIVLTAVAMALRGYMHAIGKQLRLAAPANFKALQPGLTVLAGAILGGLVTLTSIGAGALGTVMLVYLYPLRLTPLKLIGTDLAHAIPVALLAGAGHVAMGNVDFTLLGWLLLGSFPGVWLGTYLSAKVSQELLRRVLAIVLAIVGLKALAP
jgi:uncharacterized protein